MTLLVKKGVMLQSPLARRLVVSIVLVSTLLMLFLTLVQLYFEYRRDVRGIENSLNLVEKTHIPSIVETLWSMNHKELQIQLTGMTHISHLNYAAVYEGEKRVAHAGIPPQGGRIERRYPLTYTFDSREVVLGELVLVMGLQQVYRDLQSHAIGILITNSFKTLLVVSFMFLLFYRRVIRHLHKMGDYVGKLDIGNPSTPALKLDNPKLHTSNELDVLAETLNQMRTNTGLAIAEIQRLNAELEKRVVERTAELESANHELEAFSYSVSHDLRSPLRVIDGFSHLLSEELVDKDDKNVQEHLTRIRNAVKRMGKLIDDLWTLSHVVRQKMEYSPVDLSAIAQQVVKDLKVADPQRTVDVSIVNGLVARGDQGLIRVLLDNLLGNAWKYTSSTTSAKIEVNQELQNGAPVFLIRDNGVGFNMEYAAKLFTAFHRLHGSEFPGTGIGLATVARIIQRHGGKIWVHAEEHKGATFFFSLPIA